MSQTIVKKASAAIAFVAVSLASLVSQASAKETFEIVVIGDHLALYKKMMDGRDPVEFYKLEGVTKDEIRSREVVEVHIMRVAPILGGCDCDIVWNVPVEDGFNRWRKDLVEGKFTATTVGSSYLASITGGINFQYNEDDFALSEPYIREGEYVSAAYTWAERMREFEQVTVDNIFEEATFVVGEGWGDKENIVNSGGTVVVAENWDNIFELIVAGRGDVLLQPFSPHPYSAMHVNVFDEAQVFLPIENVKITWPTKRHFIVNVATESKRNFFDALNRGIHMLHEEGLIQEWLTTAGTFPTRGADWDSVMIETHTLK